MNEEYEDNRSSIYQIISLVILLGIQLGNIFLSFEVASRYGTWIGVATFVGVLVITMVIYAVVMSRHMMIDSDNH